MIFTHVPSESCDGVYSVGGRVSAGAHACLCNEIFAKLWDGYTYRSSALEIFETNELVFIIGNAARPELADGDYAVNVEKNGVCIVADSEKELIRGFMTLLDMLRPADGEGAVSVCAPLGIYREKAKIGLRMIHYCLFPENELWELHRFLRLCAVLKYTHVIIEFWGTLRYDCMNELAWSSAYSKDEVKPIIDEARSLGLEIIPMFNHWGHASASRVLHGKHVVLDQNPALQNYFTEDGWCWDISKQSVRALLRNIRKELCLLCGEGEYFHIGCDEAYNYSFTKENMDFICDFINEVGREMKAEGRRIIAWGDMFLYRYSHYNPNNRYSCHCPEPGPDKYMLEHLDRNTVIADWQYNAKEAPVETSDVFTSAGFDCLLCPWDRGEAQMRSCLTTVTDKDLMGLMHTTWHTLRGGMHYVTVAAKGCYDGNEPYVLNSARTHTAATLRKVYPINGDYKRAGWSAEETIGVIA